MIQGGGLGAVAITFSQYTLRLIGRDFSRSRVSVAAAIAIAVVAAVNVLGVKPGSRLLNVLVILKLGALAVLIGGGLLLRPAAPASPVVSPPPPPASVSVLAFGTALVPILFAYGGWQSVNLLAEETTEPRRTLPRALVAGTAIVITVYLLANVVYLTVLSRPGLAATATPAAAAVSRIFGPGGRPPDLRRDRRLRVRVPRPDAPRADPDLLRDGARRRVPPGPGEAASPLPDAGARDRPPGRSGGSCSC